MKINCHIDSQISEEHLDLYIRQMTPQISDLLKALNAGESVLWCYDDAQIIPVHYHDIFILKVVNQGIQVITQSQTYTYRDRLSRLNDDLPSDFIKASRSATFNYHHLDHLELQANGLIDAVLTNQQHVQISRRNIKYLKERLGL